MECSDPDKPSGLYITENQFRKTTDTPSNYAKDMFGAFGLASAIAFLLYLMQWVLAIVTSFAPSMEAPATVPFPSITIDAAAASITLLGTVAIAIQVFLRLPRDSERFSHQEAIDQRQFWGPIALAMAVGAAFIIIYVFIDGLITTVGSGILDLPKLAALPMCAIIVFAFAADAVSITTSETKDSQRTKDRNEKYLSSFKDTLAKIGTNCSDTPIRDYLKSSLLVGLTTVAFWSLISWLLVPRLPTLIAFTAMSSIVTLGLVVASTATLPIALRGRALQTSIQLIPLSLVVIVVSMQSMLVAMQFIVDLDDPWAYIPSFFYGLLISFPAFSTIGVLSFAKFKNLLPPALSLARYQLEKQVSSFSKTPPRHEPREQWESVAIISILISFAPPASMFLAFIAAWLRKKTKPEQTKRLLV